VTGQLRRTLFLVAATVIAAAGLPLAGARPGPDSAADASIPRGHRHRAGGFPGVRAERHARHGPHREDIRLLVDGKAREIKTFQFVRLSFTSVEAPKAAPMLPPPFASNEGERPWPQRRQS
jgi:hypothetical protein